MYNFKRIKILFLDRLTVWYTLEVDGQTADQGREPLKFRNMVNGGKSFLRISERFSQVAGCWLFDTYGGGPMTIYNQLVFIYLFIYFFFLSISCISNKWDPATTTELLDPYCPAADGKQNRRWVMVSETPVCPWSLPCRDVARPSR